MKKSYKLIPFCFLLVLVLAITAGCGVPSKKSSAYIVLVTDADNKPIPDVSIQFCSDEVCLKASTDETGIASFEQEPGTYTVHVLEVPDGYAEDDTEYAAPAEPGLVTIVLNKK